MTRKLGWIPDTPDIRDHQYRVTEKGEPETPTTPLTFWERLRGLFPCLEATKKSPYPQKVDLRAPNMWPSIFDQGDLGSCVANAWSAAMYFALAKEGAPPLVLSRLFLYYNARGGVAEDTGTTIRDGIKSVANLGDCKETTWPYDLTKWTQKPSSSAFSEALKRKAIEYSRLTSLDDMLHCISSGYPFVYGMSVYAPFEELNGRNYVLPMPKKTDEYLGGHALCVVGYDQSKKYFIVRNSWGNDWGQSGYFMLPFAYATDTNLADDFWTVRTVPNVTLAGPDAPEESQSEPETDPELPPPVSA